MHKEPNPLDSTDVFARRHIGPNPHEIGQMLKTLGVTSILELMDQTVPKQIRSKKPLQIGSGRSELEALSELKQMVSENRNFKSYLGMGYADCFTPPVIQRNILENPGWYTQYTPYQAEIAQGRLEALLNFQTMVMDFTGLPVANASLLDEGTAAAEAMGLCFAVKERDHARSFWISEQCHPQTIDVVRTRARSMGISIVVGNHELIDFSKPIFGVLLQYPGTDGTVFDYRAFIDQAHKAGAMVVMAADMLALAVLESPGMLDADVAVGSTQRFGVPMGYGGPHAAYLSTREEFKRLIPGRIVGVSQDADGRPAIRLALQTREQHIRRDKATSNICTAQVLLAVMASMYAVYHGPKGVRDIANRIHLMAQVLAAGLKQLGYKLGKGPYFDTLSVELGTVPLKDLFAAAEVNRLNVRKLSENQVGITLDETTTVGDLKALFQTFSLGRPVKFTPEALSQGLDKEYRGPFARKSAYLTHPVFNRYHSETEMLRYIRRLESRDLSLTSSMIALGSCTMKLNAAAEMFPVSWPEISKPHPFTPADQVKGYRKMLDSLSAMLSEITGFPGISLQPNAGSQGEYAGLLVIRGYLEKRGETHRNVCLIPKSAHGTNPASAAMAGMKIVVVECDDHGNISVEDLRTKATQYSRELAALMVTYPSTHGVFEESITEVCEIVHRNGGQVYMDGANMNAQVGLCRPGDFGADVCHLNLHKTFCIPHGGGGPGMGPIGVKAHLIPHLPTHPVVQVGDPELGVGAISAAPWGSASILPISWMYITMMGGHGLTEATQVAILNANYIAERLQPHFPVLYRGGNGRVAHECIIDLRHLKTATGIEVEDVAKRLMDYGFHAPTVSFPVPGTIMIEPTESESKAELDRFCEAMIAIRGEISEVEAGKADRANNLLKNAPHTSAQVVGNSWDRPYSRERAAFPTPWTREQKFWPSVARINNVLGDRQLVCACPPTEAYS